MFKNTKNHFFRHVALYSVLGTVLFLVMVAFGEGMISGYGLNTFCYKNLGCSAGFFGYDAVEHFLFGILAVWILVWLFKKFPDYSLFTTKRWKNILILLVLAVFISVLWEFLECAHDAFRVEILGQSLLDFRLHLNILDQPTNIDTMGDLVFGATGALLALLFIEL